MLTISGTFNPSQAGSLCGLGIDPATGDIWVHGCSAADIQHYSRTGLFLSSVTRPGEAANDVDVEFAPKGLTLNTTLIPSGTLLFINGEVGPAEVYAVDKSTGSILATLNTAFRSSHVVGGAYHKKRNTFFLVQDLVPAVANRNRIAEINPSTGAVLNSFQITSTFPVNFGDLEVCSSTGNLIVASSDQSSLAEYTPTGAFVQSHALPVGVSSLSGIGIDDATGDGVARAKRAETRLIASLRATSTAAASSAASTAGTVRAIPRPDWSQTICPARAVPRSAKSNARNGVHFVRKDL